jgi:hypothetical protein
VKCVYFTKSMDVLVQPMPILLSGGFGLRDGGFPKEDFNFEYFVKCKGDLLSQ